ncbi:putative sugar transporter [Schistosoma mansoni]|uniref:putative sugar transporter n=1 Tax=Schistosoma mansoni TaxID=6183 RepID=UPI0001A639FC|nr:putative sugar transporter [Schistosoma mansoni]|eukprot:XP_018654875.1 putative sugar transporter [Schistosoma mansoni]
MESENAVKRSGVQTVLDQLGFGWYQVRVIIIIGTAQATDTMETLIQAILGPTLRCEWNMSSDYVALLTTLVFLGICIGSPPIGYLSDRLGRKDLNILCCLALIYMTWLCAISPTYMWLAVLRFISGLYIGGLLTAGCSMISEVLPESYQPTGQLLVCFFDSFIALYVTGVGLGCSTSKLSWRFFILFTTAPLILCALGLTYCIQESPVILAQWGNYEESAKVLDKIAKCNDRIPNIIDKENTYSSKHYSLSNYLSIAFCMPSNLLRFFFFATRAVASAGNNATAIYITGLYAPRIRSFVFGVMSTCFRIGVLTAPYLGQVFLQRVSALGAVLIFSAIALIGFVFSIFLPHAGDKHFTSTTISKGVFRRIFKGNKSKTKQNDDGMKSVTNPAYKDDEKTIRTIVEEIKRKDNNKPAVLPVEQILNSTSVEEVTIVPHELVVVALTPCNPV